MRFSAELLQVRATLVADKLNPLERVRYSARGLELRGLLGSAGVSRRPQRRRNAGAAPEPISAAPTQLITDKIPQKNGGVLVVGDAEALDTYARSYLDQAKYTKAPTGLLLSKSQARLAQYLPTSQEALPSGAVIYRYADGGVAVAFEQELSGIASDLPKLKSLMAQRWGAEKYRAVFGEDAAPADVAAYQAEQDAIAQRKADNAAAAIEKAEAPQREKEAAEALAKVKAEELARIQAEQDQASREDFEKTIGVGKAENPVYQAYLDTLEVLPTYEDGNSAFLGFATLRAGEFERLSGRRVSADKAGHLAYVRQWADEHLSERVKAARAPAEPAAVVEDPIDTPAVQHDIIEYTTKRGKVLRGIIRTDLSQAQAKAIDPYTWRMNGGYFIREQHLAGDTAHIQAAPAPVVLSPEQQAEKAATDERLAEERRQKALATQVEKLRSVADKAVEGGEADMGRDRLTNTARRAGMAASAIAKAATNKADGLTLNNIADAIEVGAAGLLTKLSSRAQLEELQRALRLAQYETDRRLSYSEQLKRKGRPFDEDDLKNVVMPSQVTWANRFNDAAKIIAKKSPTGNARLIAALYKMGARAERFTMNPEDAAITRKAYDVLKGLKEGYTLQDAVESLARQDRLARMGITDAATLREAARELLPMMVAKTEESAVKKAERAIIGQKVGIDFFPTPANVAQRMARLAGISKGTRVLEPSAGNGNLADAAKAAGGEVDVIEISSQLRDILTAKGYAVVDHDFDGFKPEQPYQAILMNPPFSQRRDAAHIMRAYGMLASGGRLVAIAGEGVFFGQDQKAVAFREWLDTHNATVEKLEGGTFKDKDLLAQTGANGRLIVLKK
ncbi:hypothetical protein AB4P95_29845 (plasmid) [Pseudomonas sp. A1437]|uniref:hypothetical protein n=1 Tax=Pseudomonas sp. A1437 TaxID=3235107 RepID=UPI003783E08C